MPLRQKLRRAFLRLPCGHGGSQFAGSGESPVLIPPSRVCSPQIGLAAPAPSISQARGTPNPRENPENIPRASTPASVGRARQRDNGVPPEVKRLSAIGPEYSQNQESIRGPMRYDCNPEPVHGVEYDDNSELVHITGYDRHSGSFHDHVRNSKPAHGCEQISQPIIGRESLDQPGSPLGSELRLSSISSQTSDYSNHSITHSLHPTSRPASRSYSYVQEVNCGPHETGKQDLLAESTTTLQSAGGFPTNDGENDTSSLKRTFRYKPGTYGGSSGAGLRQPLETIPSFVSSQKGNTGNTAGEEWGQELGKEERVDEYTHWSLGVDRITQEKDIEEQHHLLARKASINSTTVKRRSLDPIIHTRIQPVEREEVTTVITREIHHIDIYPIIQPIIDTERLPRKHYLKTPDGKLIEITAEDAEQEGWDEVWRGDIVVGKEVDNGDNESTGIEELERRLAIDRSKTTPSPVPYINERILSDSSRKIPKLLGFGTRTGSVKKANSLHTSGERNILVGPAH